MAIDKDMLDRLLADYQKPEDLAGENGVLRQLTKALMERAPEAEMATHLGYVKQAPIASTTVIFSNVSIEALAIPPPPTPKK